MLSSPAAAPAPEPSEGAAGRVTATASTHTTGARILRRRMRSCRQKNPEAGGGLNCLVPLRLSQAKGSKVPRFYGSKVRKTRPRELERPNLGSVRSAWPPSPRLRRPRRRKLQDRETGRRQPDPNQNHSA